MSARLRGACALLLGLAAAAPLRAQSAGQRAEAAYAGALEVSRRATARLGAEGLAAVASELEAALRACPPGDGGQDCRRVLGYSLGYAYQSEASRRPEAGEELLREASGWFQEVLREDPAYDPARRGLAVSFRRMGAREWQEPLLRELAGDEHDPTGEFSLLLGDYHLDRGEIPEAAAAFLRAARLRPEDALPRRRLLDAFRRPEAPVEELLPELERWRLRFPELAAEGYALLMRRRYPESWSRAADVLPSWLLAHDALDQIGPHLAVEVPEDWSAEPFAALRRFLLEPSAEPPGWWMGSDERRSALAVAALSLGRWRIAEGEPGAAERVWRLGLGLAVPQSAEWIDLTSELAVLYDRVRELDPDGRRFAALEHEIFAGKGGAISRRDYAAMLRFHGALGHIYARRREWGSPGNPRSAIYQIEHALAAAETLRGETGIAHPLPELKERLVEAYAATGAAEAARRALAAAALAHLDADDFDGAARVLGMEGATTEGALQARRWLELRRAAAAARGRGCPAELLAALRREPAAGAEPDFAPRQRFRALGDCAAAGGPGAAELAAEALDGLLSARAPLVGVADLARLEDARATVFRSFGQAVDPLAPSPAAAAGGALPLTLPDDGRGAYVQVGGDLPAAVAVVRALRPSENPVRLRVQDGVVTVLDEGGLGAGGVAERLRGVSGVSAVRLPGSDAGAARPIRR